MDDLKRNIDKIKDPQIIQVAAQQAQSEEVNKKS